MPCNRAIVLAVVLFATAVTAQEYKIEVLKEGPPAALGAELKEAIAGTGYRVVDDQGKPFAEFWLRKAIPASARPTGPQGAVLFPVLAPGDWLGALRYLGEGHDYRDQTIAPGLYTLRYGLQPVNGDHLGVSTYRDYVLLSPAAKDKTPSQLPTKRLEEQSAESAGTNHPAVLMLLTAPPADGPSREPKMVHTEALHTWGAVVPLTLAVKGDPSPSALPVQLILVGMAMD